MNTKQTEPNVTETSDTLWYSPLKTMSNKHKKFSRYHQGFDSSCPILKGINVWIILVSALLESTLLTWNEPALPRLEQKKSVLLVYSKLFIRFVTLSCSSFFKCNLLHLPYVIITKYDYLLKSGGIFTYIMPLSWCFCCSQKGSTYE